MCFVLFWWVDDGNAPSIDDVHLFSVDFYISHIESEYAPQQALQIPLKRFILQCSMTWSLCGLAPEPAFINCATIGNVFVCLAVVIKMRVKILSCV